MEDSKPKGKKKLHIKEPPIKEYALISKDEVSLRENKYFNHLADLRLCIYLLDDAFLRVDNLKLQRSILKKWNTYVQCDGLPKAHLGPHIRLFFEKQRFFENEKIQKNIDWTLSIDERSILSQDIDRIDLTRNTLKDTLQANFGAEYNERIELGLEVLKRMEYYLDNKKLIASISASILNDLLILRVAVQTELKEFFNRYVYQILASGESYMTSIDAITMEYVYLGENFEIHLWSLKDVPIRFTYMDDLSFIANLYGLKISLYIPYGILKDNLSIRGIHLSYDHCSQNAKSYEQELIIPHNFLNLGVQDLHESLINEWQTMVAIQTEVRNKMVQRRAEYEELLILLEEETKARAKQEKAGKKVKRSSNLRKRLTKEPPIINSDQFPDVWDDFIEKEQKQFEDFLNTVYHPDNLELLDDEINLKKFIIVGGIYSFDFVEKPAHCQFNLPKFNMTWHENKGELQLQDNVYAENINYNTRMSKLSLAKRSQLSLRTHQSTMTVVQNSEVCPWFIITFDLPRYLCLWGEPIACQFEEITEYIDEDDHIFVPQKFITPTIDNLNKGHIPNTDIHSGRLKGNLTNHSQHDIQSTRASLPRVHISNIFHPSVFFMHTVLKKDSTMSIVNLNNSDFDLRLHLDKDQIRQLQRHCVPRIISSFKFPIEIAEEESENAQNKVKSKAGTLLRKRVSNADPVPTKNDKTYTTRKQNNPERLFPYYEKTKPLYPRDKFPSDLHNSEPQTFHEVIGVFDIIKKLYLDQHQKILKLPFFKSAVKIKPKEVPKIGGPIMDGKPGKSNKAIALMKKRKNSVRKSIRRKSFLPKKVSMLETSRSNEVRTTSEFAEGRKVRTTVPGNFMHNDSIIDDYEESDEEDNVQDTRKTRTYMCWSTKNIIKTEFNKELCKISVWTDRLGTFGFAFKRYEHFPFRFWRLEASEENPETEVTFTLETQFVRVVLHISSDGYRGFVTDPTKTFVRNPNMYLIIKEPIDDIKELKKRFCDKNINIFSDHDASFYIENGYFSQKHIATEMHTYNCMALHCNNIKFRFSSWNRLAKRRDIVLHLLPSREPEDNLYMVRVTPENATFVEIKELCSNTLDIIMLEYTLTWRNIENYSDLNLLINSLNPAAAETRIKDPSLICCIKNLLSQIRPLSFS